MLLLAIGFLRKPYESVGEKKPGMNRACKPAEGRRRLGVGSVFNRKKDIQEIDFQNTFKVVLLAHIKLIRSNLVRFSGCSQRTSQR